MMVESFQMFNTCSCQLIKRLVVGILRKYVGFNKNNLYYSRLSCIFVNIFLILIFLWSRTTCWYSNDPMSIYFF